MSARHLLIASVEGALVLGEIPARLRARKNRDVILGLNMDATNDFRIDQGGCLEALAKHIERRLKERPFCVVFEDETQRCWPQRKLIRTELDGQIQVFANSHGWSVSIHDFESGRIGAIFLPF